MHSPAFAAFHAQRLRELRVRINWLCRQAWDVNAVWLVRRDLGSLVEQAGSENPGMDGSGWQALAEHIDLALELPGLPDEAAREDILAAFRRIDMAAFTEPVSLAIRRHENDRIEIPPPAFWRRWADDAPEPTWTEPAAASSDTGGLAPGFDFNHVDIDAMIVAGKVGRSSLEIIHETVAPHLTQVEPGQETGPAQAADEFLVASADKAVTTDDYDWSLDEPSSSSVASGTDRSLDAFWEATSDPDPIAAQTSMPAEPAGPPATPGLAPSPEAPRHSAADALPSPPPAIPPAASVMPATRPVAPASITQPLTARSTTAVGRHPITPEPARPALHAGAGMRIYHLTESDDLACELDQRLEQLEYELELLDSAEELKEVLGALLPNLVLVDAQFEASLASIGEVLRVARQRSSEPIRLLVLCAADTMQARLSARRVGADALLFDAQTSDEVIAGIEKLLHPAKETPYRVLVVEDDRSQGLFAESILRNAGMEVEVIEDGLRVMEAMHRFQPDLVLMDLYMPDCNGMELTAMIREQDAFIDTPIVFLSGESDQDKHYEAMSAGGDDFLAKPIRPKYLIATVTNRIRRAHAIRRRNQPVVPQADPAGMASGLFFRAAMLERLEQALVESDPAGRNGGVLYVGVEGVPDLRQRLGLTTVEELLEDVAQFVVTHVGSEAIACRYGDGSFLIFDPHSEPDRLRTDAEQIRDTIRFHPFETPREVVALQVAVGVADLRQPHADAAAVLDAAELDSRAASDEPAATTPTAATAARLIDPDRARLLVGLLHDAIEQGHLDLDYQPIVALQSDAQAQYQTLLRLRRPGQEDVAAAELLPILRTQGRLPEFDRWVLLRALEVAATRLAMAKPVTLFVSQAVDTLCQPDYAKWLDQQLLGAGRIGSSLVIEINVDEIRLELVEVQAICTGLVAHGVRLCLSRYRATESQDSVLSVLPVDLVKIAPDLIAGLKRNGSATDFGTLVERLHERGIEVIAPRVEDTRTAALLWMSRIDYIQGNLVQLAGRSLDFDFNAAVL